MRRRKMSLSEAIELFGFHLSCCQVTKELIGSTFRKLCFSVHTDKNKEISSQKSGEMIGKFTEAKKVLLENIKAITQTGTEANKKVNSTFVDYIKTADLKNRKSPFSVYKKGKGK